MCIHICAIWVFLPIKVTNRKNKTILDMLGSMSHYKKLPKCFLPEAAACVVYIWISALLKLYVTKPHKKLRLRRNLFLATLKHLVILLVHICQMKWERSLMRRKNASSLAIIRKQRAMNNKIRGLKKWLLV